MNKRILISGFFDGVHPGHLDFLTEASALGEVHVCVGTDRNYFDLRGTVPLYTETDRLRLLQANRLVETARLSSGRGILDFEPDIDEILPDALVVSADGDTREKRELCTRRGVEYIVLDESSIARKENYSSDHLRVPYRICLAGGWLDQPWVSSVYPGPVVVLRIKPTIRFTDRSGMATSTRKTILHIWSEYIPSGDYEKVAKILFGAENPPGSKYISGSQDAIGLVYPGLSRLDYIGGFWPSKIENCIEPETLNWLEKVVHMVPIAPRPDNYDPLIEKYLTAESVKPLAQAGSLCWEAIMHKDIEQLGVSLSSTWKAWKEILPNTVPDSLIPVLEKYDSYPGCSLSGCGGGYALVVSENPVEGQVPINVC